MELFKNVLQLHSETLSIRERRNTLLASNIANAATPHYKARDINFKMAIEDAMLVQDPQSRKLDKTNDKHMKLVDRTETVGFRKPTQPSEDGNTVELGVEQMQFSENITKYQISLSFVNKKISGLMTAIKGE